MDLEGSYEYKKYKRDGRVSDVLRPRGEASPVLFGLVASTNIIQSTGAATYDALIAPYTLRPTKWNLAVTGTCHRYSPSSLVEFVWARKM